MDVVGIGTPCFDELFSIEKLPVTDHHAHTLASSWQYGGKVPTGIVALARLGYKTAIQANVGGIFGKCIRYGFERHGVDCSNLRDVPGTESWVTICLAEKSTGGRSFLGFRHPFPTPEMKVEELNREALMQAKVLFISDMDGAPIQAAEWFKEAGKPVVIDGDYLPPDDSKFYLIDHLLLSFDAYKGFFGEDGDYEKNLNKLRKSQKNDRAVTGVTLGSDGLACIGEDGKYFRAPAFKVNVVDTTGAGDVFHGAYIAGMLNGYDTEGACRFAQAVSAVKCARLGGRAGIPTRAQTEKFMETGRYDFPELDERAEYYKKPPFEKAAEAYK
jgi:sulfofructose kinase